MNGFLFNFLLFYTVKKCPINDINKDFKTTIQNIDPNLIFKCILHLPMVILDINDVFFRDERDYIIGWVRNAIKRTQLVDIPNQIPLNIQE